MCVACVIPLQLSGGARIGIELNSTDNNNHCSTPNVKLRPAAVCERCSGLSVAADIATLPSQHLYVSSAEAGDIETVQSDSAYKDEEDPLRRKVDLYLDLKSIHTLQYIAGRISKKLSTEFPELKGSRNESCTWINLKNSGGLDYPSNSFMEDVKKMEIEFRLFHGEKINMSPNPIENLSTLIMKKSTLPERVILYFVKIRFFHRLKELNLKLSGAKVPIRTLKQHGQFIN